MGDSIDSKTVHIRNHSVSGRAVKEVETTAYNTSPIFYIMCRPQEMQPIVEFYSETVVPFGQVDEWLFRQGL